MSITPLRHRSAPPPTRGGGLSAGAYLTDGERLFRVVSQFPANTHQPFASLEDCLTLQVQAYSPGELEAMRLRPVGLGES
jgi:hypothetical protein